jgi:hypothetical protein
MSEHPQIRTLYHATTMPHYTKDQKVGLFPEIIVMTEQFHIDLISK